MKDKELFKELESEIKKDGVLWLGMVHQTVYGPLRGLNFILKNPNPKEVHSHLTNGGMDAINFDVWSKTMLAARLMVLPREMVSLAETPPIEVNSIKEGEEHIRKMLKKGDGDFWYFRVGIV